VPLIKKRAGHAIMGLIAYSELSLCYYWRVVAE